MNDKENISKFFNFLILQFLRLLVRPHFSQLGLQTLYSEFDLLLPEFQFVLLGSQHHDRLESGFFGVGSASLFVLGLVLELLLGFWVSFPFSLDLGFGLFVEGDSVDVDKSMRVLLLFRFLVIIIAFGVEILLVWFGFFRIFGGLLGDFLDGFGFLRL